MHPKPKLFLPKNPKKWINPNNIIARSNLERRFFKWADENPGIIKIASEEFFIPYVSPIDGRPHRYFVDLIFQTQDKKTYIAEIKPFSQVSPPKKTKRNTKSYNEQLTTYLVNDAKWQAAKGYAEKHGMEFYVLTENTLKNVK